MTDINTLRKLAGLPVTEAAGGNIFIHLNDQELQRIQEMFLSLARQHGKEEVLDDLWSEQLTRAIATELKHKLLNTDLLHDMWKAGKFKLLLDEVPF